ncbi:uncharacterized protein K444DRAFT_720644, partial [Hyaloscypha bicolor E]
CCKISCSRRLISACSTQQCSCTRRRRGPCLSFSMASLCVTLSAILSTALRQSRSAWRILPWNGPSAPSVIVIEKQFGLASLSALVTLSQMWLPSSARASSNDGTLRWRSFMIF